VTRRRRPRQAGDQLFFGEDQVLQMLAYRLRVPQVVMLLDQTVEQPFRSRPPDLFKTQRPQGRQGSFDGTLVDFDGGGLGPLGQRIGRRLLPRRQADLPASVQGQHQAPTHHVPGMSIGLKPVPGPAKFLG